MTMVPSIMMKGGIRKSVMSMPAMTTSRIGAPADAPAGGAVERFKTTPTRAC